MRESHFDSIMPRRQDIVRAMSKSKISSIPEN